MEDELLFHITKAKFESNGYHGQVFVVYADVYTKVYTPVVPGVSWSITQNPTGISVQASFGNPLRDATTSELRDQVIKDGLTKAYLLKRGEQTEDTYLRELKGRYL